MKDKLAFQQATILHTRPYRDTSLLVEFFTLENGRLTAVARGAKRQKSSLKGLLQPFTPLLINYFGKNDLVTLGSAEMNGMPINLQGNHLLSGIYLNELIIRLLERFDPHPKLYQIYVNTLAELQQSDVIEPSLRAFELALLQELGYGIQFDRVTLSNEAVKPAGLYLYSIDSGIIPMSAEQQRSDLTYRQFSGRSLLAIQQRDFADKEILFDAKRLLRQAITPLLGHKPIHSRELFAKKYKSI